MVHGYLTHIELKSEIVEAARVHVEANQSK